MFNVFLCYNWDDDKRWADGLHDDLNRLRAGIRGRQELPFGDMLAPALREALLGSSMLVALIGP